MKHAKMRKCLKMAVSALVCFAVAASTIVGFAYRIDYDGGDLDFTLSGKMSDATPGQIVTLKVEDEGDALLYTRQTETDELGEYTFTFNVLEGGNGDIKITVNEGETPESKDYYKSTTAQLSAAITKVKTDGICAAIDANAVNAKVLQIDGTVAPNGALAKYVDANKTYDTLSGFLGIYKKGLFQQELAKTTGDDAELYALMAESGIESLLTGNASEEFAAYDESEKTDVLSGMRGKSYINDTDFTKAFTEAIIINELSKSSTDNEKWAVLSNNNDYLEMPIDKYESLSKFTKLKEELFAKPITSLSAMKSSAETIYTNLNKKDDGDNNKRGDRDSVSVSGGLIKPPAPAPVFGFNDLEGYDWAKSAILMLTADGIVNGKSEGIFAPGDNVTRAEFAKIIIGAFGLVDNSAEINFADTPKSHWSYKYIASAAKENIVTGVSATSFNPDGKITRQDMATICYRVLKSLGIETSSEAKKDFADASQISGYAKEAVDALSGLGIINGKGNDKFAPMDYATRAEAAKIIHSLRALN